MVARTSAVFFFFPLPQLKTRNLHDSSLSSVDFSLKDQKYMPLIDLLMETKWNQTVFANKWEKSKHFSQILNLKTVAASQHHSQHTVTLSPICIQEWGYIQRRSSVPHMMDEHNSNPLKSQPCATELQLCTLFWGNKSHLLAWNSSRSKNFDDGKEDKIEVV